MKNIQSTKTAKMNEFIKATIKKTTRIYVDKLTLKTLTSHKLNSLEPYYKNTTKYTQLFSHEGVFRIEKSQLFRINVMDKSIIIKKDYYLGQTLLLDESNVEKDPVLSQLPYDHLSTELTLHHYSVSTSKEPKLTLVVEGYYDNEISQNANRYTNFTPTNFYFLAIDDIEHLLIKQELVELLTALI
jgi:hypothetical protein